ncbi:MULTISPECIES: hypothetical protein [Bacillus subtilis group]|uniref:hypothetical protein n=1 Tax=Bacillus subtilis group TaxID=653685 RepID=UPI000A6715C3|nr:MULTISPECIES: hypothetical protein [Bacillus subtilis group]MEC2098579.1 hypothetical protein [Bacillus paralicheniformis]MEC2114664.1 hypothetical protein [Bacillus paralicheniformis]MEC2318485.1 hypothetical protein [Bacillus paralicheniformis]VEB19956.1 Uncharacterised protein [Bacillus paralicheniformis]
MKKLAATVILVAVLLIGAAVIPVFSPASSTKLADPPIGLKTIEENVLSQQSKHFS